MCNLNVRECWKSRTSGRERARNRHIQTEMFNEIIENGFEGNWIWRIVWLKLSPRVAHVISRRVLETIQYYGHSTANALGSRINTPAILKCVMQVHNYKPFDAWSSSLSLCRLSALSLRAPTPLLAAQHASKFNMHAGDFKYVRNNLFDIMNGSSDCVNLYTQVFTRS